MNISEGDDLLSFRRDNHNHDEIVPIESGKSRKFHHISFATDEAGLQTVTNNLKARDIALLDRSYKYAGNRIWFRGPEGNLVNTHIASIEPHPKEE